MTPGADLAWTLRGMVRSRLLEQPAGDGDRAGRVERAIEQVLDAHARQELASGRAVLDPATERRIARQIRDGLLHFGGFQQWLDDPQVENITCNGADVVHVCWADGRKRRVGPVADSDEELVELVRQIAAHAGLEERRFDRGVPRLSVQLPDGSRLFAVMAVCTRPSVTLRRHRYLRVDLAELVGLGTVDARLADLFTALVLAGKNVVVSGGTNVGKTTFLRGLAAQIPPGQRLVTVEDAFELGLDRDRADVVALQAREPNLEGVGEIGMAELVRWALRMLPDRVIVGEARGGEVIPMCQAMSQGNDGSLATVHASSSAGALLRLSTYAVTAGQLFNLEAANLLVGGAVHVVAHLDRHPSGRRVISSVREVVGADGALIVSNELFTPGPDRTAVPASPPSHQLAEDLATAGAPPQLWNGGLR
jgi:Flp pilus assembly CpaF family ATPase